jgi:subtilisin family serine protease
VAKRTKKTKTAARARKKTTSKPLARAASLEPEAPQPSGAFGAQTTGRMIVTFLDSSRAGARSALAAMKNRAGVAQVSHARDFKGAFSMADAESADALVFDELGIAVMTGDADQMSAMSSFSPSVDENVIVEPEYVNYAFQDNLDEDLPGGGASGGGGGAPASTSGMAGSLPYLQGYRDALDHLVKTFGGGGSAAAGGGGIQAAADLFQDTTSATWGLQATEVAGACGTGNGIKLAVLDTGFDLTHPDFAGRSVQTSSFISGESVQDGNGHGTHCIGTSCGPRRPGIGPRYGIASGAQIFAGKVLSNAGSGGDASILAGINWAIQNGCQIVSMSLGRRVSPGEAPQTNYQTAGSRALAAGTLIVAAAGNDSRRPFVTIPVSSPANAGSIAAIAAVDRFLQVASFSNRAINPSGGEINLAGPGVDVHSSWPMPIRLRSISGTSMATPHVAGVAALVAEENPSFRGLQLYLELRRRARSLPLPQADVGNGLVRV